MLKKIIYALLKRRHFWRYASFSEIAELYISRTLRVIAMSIASGFASVYLYQIGYSLLFIMEFWTLFYLTKVPLAFLSSYVVARIGPKHGILLSNIISIPAMVSLGLAPILGFTTIIIWGCLTVVSASIYQICYVVDFSKVKNVEHAGKELAFMNILEKIAIGISPIIGGLIALYFGPSIVMWAAALFYIAAAIPLLMTIEPVHTHQTISYRNFPWGSIYRSLISQVGLGFDVITTTTVWSLFITIVIFPNVGNEVYVTLGTLSSVTALVAIAASYTYGKIIDRSKGGMLLKASVVANALVHVSRAFANNPATIVGTNITNEIATTGYNMAYIRGVFDAADQSGHRIVYLSTMEAVSNLGAAFACIGLICCISLIGISDGLRSFFFLAAAFVLLIGTAKFRLYRA
jgi:hypothetical protein